MDRCILPDISTFYESAEGQKEFAAWQIQQTSDIVRETSTIKTNEHKVKRHQKMVTLNSRYAKFRS